jgi:hypothetical protein
MAACSTFVRMLPPLRESLSLFSLAGQHRDRANLVHGGDARQQVFHWQVNLIIRMRSDG